MTPFLLAAALLQAALPQAAIVRYEERATLDSASAAVQLSMVLTGRGATAEFPLRWTSAQAVRIAVSTGATAHILQSPGGLRLSIRTAPDADTTAVGVDLLVPRVGVAFEHRFVAPSGVPVAHYVLAFRLPRNSVPRSISWSAPEVKGSAPGSPLHVTHDTLSRIVSLVLSDVGDGEVVSLTVEPVSDRRSPLALVIGAALAAIWLLLFRDLVWERAANIGPGSVAFCQDRPTISLRARVARSAMSPPSARVHDPVVQPVGAALPELHLDRE